MSYIGAEPTTAAFPFDQFSGNGSTTAFTLTYAPASATSIIVAISGVMQNPNLYSVVGTTLTFSPAPPTGTNNISVLYLGLPVIGSSSPGNTAFLSSTDLTATAGQTVFASAGSYTPGFVQVFRNGARLGNADFTATNGTTITLASAATAGDLVTIEYYTLTSLTNALPLTGGTVTGSTTFNSAVTVNGAAVSGFTGMKNRIINGNMVVDQRNAGAAVTISTSGVYALDRWKNRANGGGAFSVQQSSTAPAGFNTAAVYTVTTVDSSIAAGDNYYVFQDIEGYNVADLGFGTANAQTITMSFWVRSSVTGTYSVFLSNGTTYDRGYVATYTINAANTYEYKTVTIAGDTTGTWGKTNGGGLSAGFNLGAGTTYQTTAGAWGSAFVQATSGTTQWISNAGATFYITGVQLERGSNATSFEFIDYGRQLAQCQRYFISYGGVTQYERIAVGVCNTTTTASCMTFLPVPMRIAPTLTYAATWGVYEGSNVYTVTSIAVDHPSNLVFNASYTVAAGLTTNRVANILANNNTTARLQLSAEL
jgi:hypothetical protein